MSGIWAERERRTNRLVRAVAQHLFAGGSASADQIYGLCKLTWITNSYSEEDAAYIRSTKIPALGDVFARDYSGRTIEEVAADVSAILRLESVADLVQSHTGFTNLYRPYRNTAREWMRENLASLLPLFIAALSLRTDREGFQLVQQIENLPGVPKANHEEERMRPEYLLTPAFFALDPRLRFPLINGNKGVQDLLAALNMKKAPLTEQYQKMTGLYGTGGIRDAADLDQVGADLPDFIGLIRGYPTKQLLQEKPTEGTELPLKDEADIELLQQARRVTSTRQHNRLTNRLRRELSRYTLLEGCHREAQFDTLVKDYDGQGGDLLVEVKSSTEAADIRMAIGQLCAYWFHLYGDAERHLAVLLPNEPGDELKSLLEWLDIGVLWFSANGIETCTDWLEHLAE